jgi:subtilisin family serine protease
MVLRRSRIPTGISLARTSLCCVAVVFVPLLVFATTPAEGGVRSSSTPSVSVIVRSQPAADGAAERAVRRAGGKIGRRIALIDGFVADVPAKSVGSVRSAPGVHSVTPNRRVELHTGLDGWDHTNDIGSMYYVAQEVSGAGEMWNDGWTGKGVDVALIDSGVAPVDGLRTAGKVVYGADLSFESQAANLRHHDTFGHGTHLAGIIAGRDDATPALVQKGEESFVGMAPDARIVSVKVADAFGATDVSQVLAAIDWVVQHKNDNGLNIRVLNLSFGTDGEQDYRIDPLTYAVEVAWRKGIVVVVAAGNGGFGSAKLNNPAYDPFVIAVGGADGGGTYDFKDDTVQPWSSAGDGTRNPDLVAPGKSIVSLRAPGSYLDGAHPAGRVGSTPRFFRGSGTSQAAAVVSGAAALIIEQRPRITPDQVKALLERTASKLSKASPPAQGEGMLNLRLLRDTKTPSAVQTWQRSFGIGSLERSRGSAHLELEGTELRGEADIFGAPFRAATWSLQSAAGISWVGGSWNGNTWTGNTWSANTWTADTWSANTWTGNTWSGNTWTANTWTGNTWSGNTWTANTWSGNTWTANTWSGIAWGG